MRKLLPIILIIFGSISLCSYIPKNENGILDKTANDSTELFIDLGTVDDSYFKIAFDEMSAMLEGKDSLSVKRAVFLIEWAYLEGGLDYDMFCNGIDTIVTKLKSFIRINNLEKYKTGGNFALFEYFTKPNSLNGNKPFTYDFEDFTGENDYRKLFVSKVMETHTGQCTSLPLYYKILSDELCAESYLALAPHHMYIKHIDENGRWVNIELTNGHFSTDAWMISSMDISAEAIKNKIFLDALSQKESVAMLVTHLASAYKKKYGYDNFTLQCSNKTLEYFPHNLTALFVKHNTLQTIGLKYLEKYGNVYSAFIDANYKEFKDSQRTIEGYGYREITRDNYEKWVRTMEDEKENLMENK